MLIHDRNQCPPPLPTAPISFKTHTWTALRFLNLLSISLLCHSRSSLGYCLHGFVVQIISHNQYYARNTFNMSGFCRPTGWHGRVELDVIVMQCIWMVADVDVDGSRNFIVPVKAKSLFLLRTSALATSLLSCLCSSTLQTMVLLSLSFAL
jgi:hypothetical protein